MLHMAEKMYQTLEEMEAAIISRASVEKRLRGIPIEELLQVLDVEARKQLRKMLDEEVSG